MDDNLQGLLSSLIPDEIENSLGLGGKKGKGSEQDQNQLAGLLKSLAGQAGGPVENEVNNFLGGSGALFATTKASAKSGGRSSTKELVKLLTGQFNLDPTLAQTIAPLLLNLLPAIGNLTGGEAETTAKPRSPKAKPSRSPSSSKSKETSSTGQKTKDKTIIRRKTTSEDKPKSARKRSTGEVD